MFKALEGGPRPDPWPGDRVFVAVLGGLMGLTPLSVDMYLPALPAIGREFAASQHEVQLTLGVFFAGFGVGQLVWGPIGDRFGRRWPTLAGLVIFAIGSVAAALAPSNDFLIAARFLQAVGACVTPVMVRAMVRDVFDRERAGVMMSMMMLVMGAAPMLAPMIGGVVELWLGWRAIFVVLMIATLIMLSVLFKIPETHGEGKRRSAHWRSILAAYTELAFNRRFLSYAFGGAFFFGAMFAYIAGTPFVYIEIFGVPPQYYGFLFGLNVIAMMLSSTLNGRFMPRFGLDRTLRFGHTFVLFVGLAILAVGITGFGGLAGLVVTIFFYMFTMGAIGANSMAGAMSPFPHIAGAASALAGALQFAVGALTSVLAGLFDDGTALPMCAVMAGCAALAFLSNRLAPRP
jgi:DHA1 family bicyclomycin/chloramphenicol resistance-like MFS transporter